MFPFFIIGCCVSSVFYSTMHGTIKMERGILNSVFFLHNLTYPNDIQSFFFLLFPVILVTEYLLLEASKSSDELVKTLNTLSVKRKSSMIVYESSHTGRTRLENSWISEFFSRRSKCLKFFFIHFSPGKSLTFDRETFSNLQNTLANTKKYEIGVEEIKVCRTHKRIFIKIAALKDKSQYYYMLWFYLWKRCVKID